jgi:D-aminopeptidase
VWEGGLRHVLEHNPSAGREGTVNVVVGECFDGYLSDARALPVRAEHALEAIARAREDEMGEGSVGAGTGCHCLGFKAGVGTASRVTEHGGHILGCMVVANYGGRRDLHLLVEGEDPAGADTYSGGDHAGSVMVVVGTDAPLSERQLRRVAARAAFGLGRAASYARNRSGDYVIGFSTAHRVPRAASEPAEAFRFLRDDSRALSDLFEAAAETTYESVLNSLCVADAMEGRDGNRVGAFPHELLARLRAG